MTRSVIHACIAVTAMLAATPAIRAATAPQTTDTSPAAEATGYWSENGGLIVELQPLGAPDCPIDATARRIGEVFDSRDFQFMLVLVPGWEAGYVLDLAGGEVRAYSQPALLDERRELVAPPSEGSTDAGVFITQKNGTIVFRTTSCEVAILPAPPLVGEISREDLAARLPAYDRRAATYTPDPVAVQRLRGIKAPTEVMAFFGTWCSTCREELPALFATLDAAANPVLTVRLIAVAEDLSEPSDLLAAYGVGDIPTLIGSDNGIEIGRIVDAPRTKLETELAEMLGVAPGR